MVLLAGGACGGAGGANAGTTGEMDAPDSVGSTSDGPTGHASDGSTGSTQGSTGSATVGSATDGPDLTTSSSTGTTGPDCAVPGTGTDGDETPYDDDTSLSWLLRITGDGDQSVRDLMMLDDGNLAVAASSNTDEVTVATGQATEVAWSDDGLDVFLVASVQSGGEVDWTHFVAHDGMTLSGLAKRSDGTFWLGGFIDSSDEAYFTWPDATTETVEGRSAIVARIDGGGDLQELLTFDALSMTAIEVALDDTLITTATQGIVSATNAYIARWNTDGEVRWAAWLAIGSGREAALGMDSDDNDDIFVTGYYGYLGVAASDVTFGEGEAAVTLESFGEGGGFVAKFDGDGVLQWVRRFGGDEQLDVGTHVRALPDGTVAVAGYIGSDTALFGEGEGGEVTWHTPGASTAFLARFGADGELLWVRSLGEGDNYRPADVKLSPDGDIAVIVASQSDETPHVEVDGDCTWPVPEEAMMHVLAYDEDGILQWSRHDPWDGGIFDSRAGGLEFDGSTAYMGGSYHDATFAPGEVNEAYYDTHFTDAAVMAFTY